MCESIFQKYHYLTPEIARAHNVSKFKFYKYIQDNKLEQIAHGIYVEPYTWSDDLYVLHKRCPQAVFSHDEAFWYHGLTDREPVIHTMTLYSGYNAHRLVSDGSCKIYTVKKQLLGVGKTIVTNSCGNEIPLYNLERTICDLIRNRNSLEIQEFSSALKVYASRKDKDLHRLMDYAKLFKIQNVLRKYMEVLL